MDSMGLSLSREVKESKSLEPKWIHHRTSLDDGISEYLAIKEATSNRCHASSNRCLTSSNKKLFKLTLILIVTTSVALVTSSVALVPSSPKMSQRSETCVPNALHSIPQLVTGRDQKNGPRGRRIEPQGKGFYFVVGTTSYR